MKQYYVNVLRNKVLLTKAIIVLLIVLPNTLRAQENPFITMKDGKFHYKCEEHYPVVMNYGVQIINDLQGDYHVAPIFGYCDGLLNCEPWHTCGTNAGEWHAELKQHFEKIIDLGFNTIRLVGLGLMYNPPYNDPVDGLQTGKIAIQLPDEGCYSMVNGFIYDEGSDFGVMGDMLQEVIDVIDNVGGDSLELKLIIYSGTFGVEMEPIVYSNFLAYLADRFKDNPVIFAYDLYNEPVWHSYHQDPNPNKYERAETVFQWYNAIKDNAPAQFVTIGSSIFGVVDFDPGIMPVDFVSFHFYQWLQEGDGYDADNAFELYKAQLKWTSVSFNSVDYMIGETGFPGIDGVAGVNQIVGTEAEQKTFADQSLSYAKWYGSNGYSWWMYKDVPWFNVGLVAAKENFLGLVYNVKWKPGITWEMSKETGDIFTGYNPNIECANCEDPLMDLYHAPNPGNMDITIVSGTVTKPDGAPLENVFVWATIKKTNYLSKSPSENSFAITDANGHYELKTSFGEYEVKYVRYFYPGMEVKDYWDDNGLPSILDISIDNLDPALIPQIPELDMYTVESGEAETWETENLNQVRYLPYKNIIIEDGAELTITIDLFLSENAKIIVEPGGKLTIDGARLTSSCGPWAGIEVWGDPTSPYPADQGLLTIKNGAIIENAEVAIRNHHYDDGPIPPDNQHGGIINASNSTFRNNIKTIDLRNYDYNSFNSFSDCEFIYNDAYLGGGTLGYFMEIRNMRHVSTLSCDFTNNTSQDQVGKGIYSYNSQVSVKGKCVSAVEPCTEWENANFTNLEYGIYATAPSSTNYIDVRNTSFTNNYRGLYIGGITTPRVTSNEFFVIDDNNGYGLYLDESTGFWVEDNVFNAISDKKGTGIIVNDVGPAANEIYLNEFNNLKYSINAQGRNRNHLQMNEGLVLKCNDYNETKFDETILWDLPFIAKDAGIAGDQGIDNLNIEDMAGNLFFINIGGFNDYDDINNEANQIDYYFSMNALSYNVEPMDATWNTVDKHGKFTSLWTYETACESGINNGGGIEEERGKMDAAQSEIATTEAILAALVDGGDTEALNTEVETSTPPETVTVYNELMGKSPNLSETVVESTIGQETVLPNAMVRDVMVANPHTAKSQVLLDMLDERFDPMPDYMKAQILAGRSIQTLKQELESGLAGYKLQKAKAMNAIISYYREELEGPADISDSLLALFQADNTLNSAYRVAWLYLERDEYQQGLNVMGNIPSLFDLDEEGQQDYTNISGIYTMLAGLCQNGNTIESLSETELAGLQTLTAGEAGLARAYARNILIALGELEYDEPILQPDFLKSSMAIEDYNELLKAEAPQQLQAYPNPSKGYVILEYKIETGAEGLIGIKDITGKTIKTIPATEKQDQVTVLTENWQTGVYIANLTVNGKSIESVKFTIVK